MQPAGESPARVDLPPGDGDQARRFIADLSRIWPEGVADPQARLGLAVSGGPDSCALLLLATAVLPGRIAAATVDHGLREASAAEAAFVAELCATLAVPHDVLTVRLEQGNLQAQARIARYAALEAWARKAGIAALATAHHADDQAETLLLRLARASGVAGLAGVRPRGTTSGGLALLRPVLEWRRADLAGIVAAAGIVAVADPSNVDDRFDRARMRKALAGADWLDPAAIARSAAHLAEADEALEWAAQREWDEAVRRQPFGLSYRPRAPRAVVLRVIARIVHELDGGEPRGGQIAAVHDSLASGSPASIGTLVGRAEREGWIFTVAPKRRTRTAD